MIGRWLAERDPAVTGRVRLATKVAPPYVDGPGGRFDAAFPEEKFSGSLQRLGVNAVELLLTHAPDDGTPIDETLEGLEAVRSGGRCRLVGACNVDAGQLRAALDAAEWLGIGAYQVVQNGCSLLQPEDGREVRSICAERDLAFTPFSPLAGGALTGKYRRDAIPPPDSRMALRSDGVDEMLTRPCTTRSIGSAARPRSNTTSNAASSHSPGFCIIARSPLRSSDPHGAHRTST
jgi:aryl-alcohol dehydrogenase-like predicted oxidoreductase